MLKLGNNFISFPFVLAPMAGITNAPFRKLMRELGAGVVISELISSTGLEYESKKTLDLCFSFPGESPVGLQIFGENAEHLSQAAQKLEKRGVDFIDINLGCPVPKVVSKGGGAAMMREPDKLFKTLKQVVQSIQIPLTIKIRTGWDASSLNALECVEAAREAGVAWVAIHGRSRAQGYEGHADWQYISDVKSKTKMQIIGNGDILTSDVAIKRLKESGCDAVMIGRGALRNPFIFSEIAEKLDNTNLISFHRDPSITLYWALIRRHQELMHECFNSYFTGIQLRKFMTWYSAGFEGASKFRKSLYEISNDEENLDRILKLGEEFFNRPDLKKNSSFLGEAFLQGGHG